MRTIRCITISALAIIGMFVIAGAVHAEVIRSFTADVTVAKDGMLTITEHIQYDFEGLERHGIFRTIPYAYTRNALKYNARINVESVNGADGTDIPYSASRSGGKLTIKIGDADVLITGKQEYVIIYTASRVINWFDGEPEIYWNVTGDQWELPMDYVRFSITGVAPYDTARSECFTGAFGVQESFCTLETDTEGKTLTAFITDTLQAYEGFTVVTRLPAGSIPEPTVFQRALSVFADNWGFALPLITLFVLLWLYRRFGKDPAGRGTIIAEYEPPKGMSPTMLGYLLDEKIDPRDIAAGIVGLAVKGVLKINYQDRKGLLKFGHTYQLTKTGEPTEQFTSFERELHGALFADGDSVQLDELKKTFPPHIKKLKDTLQREADALGYFSYDPNLVRGLYYGIGFVLGALGFFLLGANIALFVGLLLSGGLFFAFAGAMPRKSEKGALAREQILGFKDFLTVTEKDRLKFHNAPARHAFGEAMADGPEKKPEQFMVFLPYAMALSVENQWAEQFKGMTIEQPDWYTGQNWSMFNAMIFASAMSDFGTTAQSQAFTAPNSGAGGGASGFGGGGFSGGGFGGGGGGSW